MPPDTSDEVATPAVSLRKPEVPAPRAGAAASEPDPEQPAARAPRRRRGLLVRGVLTLVLVGLLAWGVALRATGRPLNDAAALVAARQEASAFFSLDPTGIDADLDRIVATATPTFKASFTAHRDELKQGIVSGMLTVTASVPDGGVALEYLEGSRAAVLVAVDATTTAAAGTSQTSRYRMRVLLAHQGGQWLIDDLQEVG